MIACFQEGPVRTRQRQLPGCHSADMVLNQPAISKTQWREEVEKMRTAYKAPIDAGRRYNRRIPRAVSEGGS